VRGKKKGRLLLRKPANFENVMKDYTQQSAGRNGFSQPKDYIFKNNLLSPADSRIYYVLLSIKNKELENNIFPGLYRIAREANVSKSTVIRSLKKLKKLGLIDWRRRGRGITNNYSLNTESELLLKNSIDLAAEIKKEIEKMQKSASHQVRSVTVTLPEVSQRHSNNTKYNNTKDLEMHSSQNQNASLLLNTKEYHSGMQNTDSEKHNTNSDYHITTNGNNTSMPATQADEERDAKRIVAYQFLMKWWNDTYGTHYRLDSLNLNKRTFEMFVHWIEDGYSPSDIQMAKHLAEHHPKWGKGIAPLQLFSTVKQKSSDPADWIGYFLNYECYPYDVAQSRNEYFASKESPGETKKPVMPTQQYLVTADQVEKIFFASYKAERGKPHQNITEEERVKGLDQLGVSPDGWMIKGDFASWNRRIFKFLDESRNLPAEEQSFSNFCSSQELANRPAEIH